MDKHSALICIDIQNDFCPNGALAVTGGDEIISRANLMMADAKSAGAAIVLTQDWHPDDHSSFASSHDEKSPFDMVEMSYGPQVLWPKHCVIGSQGAAFHDDLDSDSADMVIRKGFRRAIDSYSAFFENDRQTPTGLHGYLQIRDISHITLIGLATDFCVAYSALDGARLGYDVTVDLSACRAIDLEGSLTAQLDAMRQAGVTIIS
ncbi:MAG: bifunctional nicotinamidase/pyrazinamidase [Candidatus Puniceispirillaceae bacterium]